MVGAALSALHSLLLALVVRVPRDERGRFACFTVEGPLGVSFITSRAALHTEQLYFILPCEHEEHSLHPCFSFPCGQGEHFAQLFFLLP